MTSLGWLKQKIHEEWEKSLPDRFDPERATQGRDENGMIPDYEHSYSRHHKTVEATAGEVKELFARYKKAEAGLLRWDKERHELCGIDE